MRLLNATIPALLLKDAPSILTTPFGPNESGTVLNPDGMYHVAATTTMPSVTGQMVDWWFGFVTTTEQYKWWHPRDHVSSQWSGPHGNSTYVGGHHLVKEYIGGELQTLKISFLDPSTYFGARWREDFKANNYTTAICGRVSLWSGAGTVGLEIGHLMHLVHAEPGGGSRMRSRFWLGDVSILPSWAWLRSNVVPVKLVEGLLVHTSEEMKYLGGEGGFLVGLYGKETKGVRRRSPRVVEMDWEREV